MIQISLESARINAGYTLVDISKKINKTEKTIHNWEKGKTAIPASIFFKLCKIYNLDSDNVKVPVVRDGRYI